MKFTFALVTLKISIVLNLIYGVLAEIGYIHWLLALLSHFHLQVLGFQFLCLLVNLVLFRFIAWPWLGALLISLGYNLSLIVPYYMPIKKVDSHSSMTLLHMNIYAPNRRFDLIKEAIRRYQPDVVELMEYTESARRGLESSHALQAYPYRITGHSHLGIYSKYPLKNTQVAFIGQPNISNHANIMTDIVLKNKAVKLLVAHPPVPKKQHYDNQLKQFENWKHLRQNTTQPMLIVGDMNTSPWSRHFRNLLQQSDLRDSQIGFGIQTSWPQYIAPWPKSSRNWAWLLSIPIDHILHSSNIYVKQRQVGPDIGSDHLPVFVQLGISD